MNKMMQRCYNPDLGSLFIRLALGAVFIHAGWGKLDNMEFTVSAFASMGIPAGLTYLVAYSEFIGGILLILGILVRYVGIVLAIIMFVAIIKVHFVNGFNLANNGYEYVFVLLLGSLTLLVQGGGKYTLPVLIRK